MKHFRQLLPLVGLLLLQFALRAHNLTAQDPYVDEGFHGARAVIIWDFDQHPGHFSRGKLLLYFWLGIFEAKAVAFLYTARTSMALISLISGACVYIIGRMLRDHATGLLALGLYIIFPLALFFERMAMADPFAAVFAALAAWRSLVFARRPTFREGGLLGILLGLGILAKLTMGLVPFLPVAAAILYGSRKWDRYNLPANVYSWLWRFVPPLVVAALVVVLIWLPVLIPAYFDRNSDHPFVLVDSYNIEKGKDNAAPVYLERIEPEITDFTSRALLIALLAVSLSLVLVKWSEFTLYSPLVFLGVWFILIGLLPILGARLISSRYFMPLSAPLVLMTAYLTMTLWDLLPWKVMRLGLVGAVAGWVIAFALPFARHDVTDFDRLALHNTNMVEYQSGVLTGEAASRKAGAVVNAVDPSIPVYISWTACHEMFFSLERPVTCLSLDTPVADLREHLNAELAIDGTAYIVISGYTEPFFNRIQNLGSQEVATYERKWPYPRPYYIWRVFWQ